MSDQNSQRTKITDDEDAVDVQDKGGRRRLPDRRQFSSSDYFPERRELGYRHRGKKRSAKITEPEDPAGIKDMGGRRRLPDRRQYSSSDHFPERRNLRYRRSGSDRRNLQNQKIRKKLERRRMFKEKYSK